jgi:hypothetical protein
MGKILKSDFLFARPSFMSGVGRTVDLFGTFDGYNRSNTPKEADTAALASDWGMVGQDIYAAMDDLEDEIEEVA